MRKPNEERDQLMGYVLKQTQANLRGAMDQRLRQHGLSVAQYACLELLDERPELSNAELARGAFVTRQAMNTVLRGLLDAGLVERPATAQFGRARPARLSPEGHELLARAREDIMDLERRMTATLSPQRREELLKGLKEMARNLDAAREREPDVGE
ncbi:MAG: MarR family winged helix-turn-helix transcriptional regulator [Stackebrandtia sp.]